MTTIAVVSADAASKPPAIMTTTPMQNIRLRPKRLPSVLDGSTKLATTSMYALGIQIRVLGPTPRSFWIADNAETAAVMSKNVIIMPRHIATSVGTSLRCVAVPGPSPASSLLFPLGGRSVAGAEVMAWGKRSVLMDVLSFPKGVGWKVKLTLGE